MPEPNTPSPGSPPAPPVAEDKIVFYDETPEVETVVEAPEVSTEEATEGTPPLAEKIEATPPSEPSPLVGTSVASETRTLEPLAPMPDVQQLAQLVSEQQTLIRQQSEALAKQQDATELAQLRAAWEGQGYSEEQIQAGLTQHDQLKQRERTITQREEALNQTLGQHQAEINAKVEVATRMSEKYGMPFAELMKFNTPQLMEAKAEAYQARQELAKAQQAKVKPHKLDTVGPGQQAATSRARLLDRYNAGERLTPEQENALFGGR